jgi:hypothetical protein
MNVARNVYNGSGIERKELREEQFIASLSRWVNQDCCEIRWECDALLCHISSAGGRIRKQTV